MSDLKLCRKCIIAILGADYGASGYDRKECTFWAHQDLERLWDLLRENKIVVHLNSDACELGLVHKMKPTPTHPTPEAASP